eukprot:802796-Pyramimonas_sp.AAC.1
MAICCPRVRRGWSVSAACIHVMFAGRGRRGLTSRRGAQDSAPARLRAERQGGRADVPGSL